MRSPDYLSVNQVISVAQPGRRNALQYLSPFSPAPRTNKNDLEACREISNSIQIVTGRPEMFTVYPDSMVVGNVTIARCPEGFVIHDDLSEQERQFMVDADQMAYHNAGWEREQTGRPTGSVKKHPYFSQEIRAQAEPVPSSLAQKAGRTAIVATAAGAGDAAATVGFDMAAVNTVLETAPGITAGVVGVACAGIALKVYRRKERKRLLAQSKTQIADLRKKVYSAENGIVFPCDTQGSSRESTQALINIIFTALRDDTNPAELWERGVGEEGFGDKVKELAALWQEKHDLETELHQLEAYSRTTGIATEPGIIDDRKQQIESRKTKISTTVCLLEEMTTIRQEQRDYVAAQMNTFDTIIKTSDANNIAAARFVDCVPPADHPLYIDLQQLRNRLTDALKADVFSRADGGNKIVTPLLDELVEFMNKHEPQLRYSAQLPVYVQLLHDTFVKRLPSLSAEFGLPAPKLGPVAEAARQTTQLETLFGDDTLKIKIVGGVVVAEQPDLVTYYESVEQARLAATTGDVTLGARFVRDLPVELLRYEDCEAISGRENSYVCIDIDMLQVPGVDEQNQRQYFGKPESRTEFGWKFELHSLIGRLLRKVDDPQAMWQSGFGVALAELAQVHDAYTSYHRDPIALQDAGEALARSYADYRSDSESTGKIALVGA